jgi:hypothetical protein
MTFASATAEIAKIRAKSKTDNQGDEMETLGSSSSFTPTQDWFTYWHQQLPLQTIYSLIENVEPDIEHKCTAELLTDEGGKLPQFD